MHIDIRARQSGSEELKPEEGDSASAVNQLLNEPVPFGRVAGRGPVLGGLGEWRRAGQPRGGQSTALTNESVKHIAPS